MRSPRWTTMLLLAAILSHTSARANPAAAVSGPMKCGINGYMWPRSSDAAPLATDVGTMEIVSDGHGKFVSGQMTQHLADDTHMAGTDICTFDLESGTYIEHSDGTIANTIVWKLRPGSDPHCGAIASRSKNLGFVEGVRDFHALTYSSTSYVLEDGRIGYTASSAQGVSMGVCEPKK